MSKLTEKDDQGNWSLKGVAWKELYVGQVITRELHERLYGALWKLMEYEDTDLSPEEVEKVNDFERSQVGMMLAKLNEEQRKHHWIPVEESLPELGEAVWATVKHSEWISDYGADWLPEEEKIYHPKSYGVYKAEYVGGGNWQYADDYNEWVYCDVTEKEKKDLANVYDTVIAWMPLPYPYKGEEYKI